MCLNDPRLAPGGIVNVRNTHLLAEASTLPEATVPLRDRYCRCTIGTLMQVEHSLTVKMGYTPQAYELAAILKLAPSHATVTMTSVEEPQRLTEPPAASVVVTLTWETGEEATA